MSPHDIGWQWNTGHTAISKAPVQGRRMARLLNIDGDGQADLDMHGSEHRAVFVYQIDSYRYWQNHFRRSDLTYGQFGENFTVEGLRMPKCASAASAGSARRCGARCAPSPATSCPRSRCAEMSGVLDDIRVIDFGQYLAGPLAALLLADQGAEVIRVDPPGGPRWRHPANAVLQRGKRSIVLDLKSPSDLAIARNLVASADVVVENFRPGVMERLGLGPLATTERHRHLIFCSLPGFAADDSRAGLAGWEGVVSAAAGLYDPRLPIATGDPIYSAVPLASSLCRVHRRAQHRRRADRAASRRVRPAHRGRAVRRGVSGHGPRGADRQRRPVVRERLPFNRAVIKRHRCGDGRWVDISPPLRGFGWLAERYLPKSARDSGIADIFNADPAASAELAGGAAGEADRGSTANRSRIASRSASSAWRGPSARGGVCDKAIG
jgi:hypothetical protein